ncbi:hypothetical protein [uncultured Draconibacterium sp.]|uniref:hypothetical protein n=1 Tax=uncultured Draconibacterium sp. TaxID=1573823 RepID=UPI0032174C4A
MIFSLLAQELETRVLEWETKLLELPEDVISNRKNSQNRSIKQILGHMIDSASNNTHRVIHLQYRETPVEYPNYATYGNNDKWIAIQNYQDENRENLVQLWKYSHIHFAHIIKNINAEKLESKWEADKNIYVTLQEMVEDFPRHFQLHINEITDLINT